MQIFLVGTGIVTFRVEAETPRQAMAKLKDEIRARKHARKHPTIGISLVNALEDNRLNFIVFDEARTEIFAGELRGEYQEPVSKELATDLRHFIPDKLFCRRPNSCFCTKCAQD